MDYHYLLRVVHSQKVEELQEQTMQCEGDPKNDLSFTGSMKHDGLYCRSGLESLTSVLGFIMTD